MDNSYPTFPQSNNKNKYIKGLLRMIESSLSSTGKALIDVLTNRPNSRRPLWFMRQAGRYLEEYRKIRSTAGSFLDLCYNPEMAAEVTIQPLKRFDLDAAILFSDILVIPQAMGCDLGFVQNEGPKVSTVTPRSRIPSII